MKKEISMTEVLKVPQIHRNGAHLRNVASQGQISFGARCLVCLSVDSNHHHADIH